MRTAPTVSRSSGWAYTAPDLATLIRDVWWINAGLLFFNVLPVYPLDGGQILYQLAELLKGRPLSDEVQLLGQKLGIAVLVALMGLAFYNDLSRLFG